ncbi:MAG: ABC transporter permease subunit, partial [Halobacteriales archaeon]
VSFSALSVERESGSLKLMLALPHSRQDVVVGKFVVRSAAMAVAVVVGFVLPGIALAAFAEFQVGTYVGYVLWVVVLSTVFVAIGVGISANTTTQWRSIAVMLAFYLVFVIFWVMLQLVFGLVLLFLLSEWPEWMPYTVQEMALGLRVVNPTGAFKILTSAFLEGQLLAPDAGQAQGVRDRSIQLWSLASLVAWTTIPLALGILRFDDADL